MKGMADFLIVGAGLYGATFARLALDAGRSVIVVDRREHAGGMAYCADVFIDKNIAPITVHTYGAHIFHTSNENIWQFVNHFVHFNRYTNSPVANHDGRLFNLPFNMNTFYEMWGTTTPADACKKLEEQRQAARALLGNKEPRNLEEQALLLVGGDIYEALIKGYTEKQWGRPCTALPSSIIKRLPVRLTFDNNYFCDMYQGIPTDGYNALVDRLLDGAQVRLGVDYQKERATLSKEAKFIIYTGSIDEYFDYKLGTLEYRSVRFDTKIHNVPNYQGVAVMNYTSTAVPYTRSIEHKHFLPDAKAVQDAPFTVVSREYSTQWHKGAEAAYPINDASNNLLHSQYMDMAQAERNVFFGGRLAEYRYYDMDDVMIKATNDAKTILKSTLA